MTTDALPRVLRLDATARPAYNRLRCSATAESTLCVPERRGVKAQLGPKRSDLQHRAVQARGLLRQCCLCERGCGVNRLAGEVGWCGCDHRTYAYSEGLLWGEEAFITPSYAIFFAGCNLRCAFCYAADQNSAPSDSEPVDGAAVASRVRESDLAPATFSLIGGEPTVHLHTALALMSALPPELPVVWNSNFYFSSQAAELLDGCVDVFVADLHFGNDSCAARIASAEHYLSVVQRNLHWAQGAGKLVVRHLVLPGHVGCCTEPALGWLAGEIPNVPVHILTNYLPPESRLIPEIARQLDGEEARRTRAIAARLGLECIQ